MHLKFKDYFCDPLSGDDLRLFTFEKSGENILHGIFVNSFNGRTFPIIEGVPVFFPKAFDEKFIFRFAKEIESVRKEISDLFLTISTEKINWSFSLEWEAHSKLNMTTTWGMTLESRFEQFLYETQSEKTE